MNLDIAGLFCCMRPSATASFSYSKIEFNYGKAYVDIFCQVDRTVILDSDYLCVSRPPIMNSNNKIYINREPGDMSGAARVTFPTDTGTYMVSYIRKSKKKLLTLGEILIVIPLKTHRDSTHESECYSPRFARSIKKRHSVGIFNETGRTGEPESESTLNKREI